MLSDGQLATEKRRLTRTSSTFQDITVPACERTALQFVSPSEPSHNSTVDSHSSNYLPCIDNSLHCLYTKAGCMTKQNSCSSTATPWTLIAVCRLPNRRDTAATCFTSRVRNKAWSATANAPNSHCRPLHCEVLQLSWHYVVSRRKNNLNSSLCGIVPRACTLRMILNAR